MADEETNRDFKKLVSYSDPNRIRGLLQKRSYSSIDKLKLNLKAYEMKRINAIDKLISMDILRTKIDAHPYQMNVALTVLKDMNINAILADEVGLGKTIEAGIILKELLIRSVINSVFIICPKALLTQWKEELREKFGEDFEIANEKGFSGFEYEDRVICSSGLLLHRTKQIQSRKWDLIIVDEAHQFRNTKSKGRSCLMEIPRSHLLLLTATPINNKLTDLFSLIDLVYPGLLETESSFKSRYSADTKNRIVRDDTVDELRNKIAQVMCRTRKIETDIPFTQRFVESRRINASPDELEFIERTTEYLKDLCNNKFKTVEELKIQNPTRKREFSMAQSNAILIFQALSIQQSLSSSPKAAIDTLNKRYKEHPAERPILKDIIKLAHKIKPAKVELLKQVLKEIKDKQAVIFCLRKSTAYELQKILNKEFGKSEVYSGDVSSHNKRKKMIDEFREGNIKYLVATDAAAEGLNLQFCNVLFNFDLHWNPMKIEQRIGRVHRFGQDKDVTIFNLSVKDTIDDYVIHVLFQKIDLFAMTIGGMETILSEIKDDVADIEKTIMDIVLRTKTKRDIKRELSELSKNLEYAKKKQQLAEKFTQGVLG